MEGVREEVENSGKQEAMTAMWHINEASKIYLIFQNGGITEKPWGIRRGRGQVQAGRAHKGERDGPGSNWNLACLQKDYDHRNLCERVYFRRSG